MRLNRITFLSLLVCAALTLVGCDILESHPYDVRVSGEKNLTAKNVALIEEATSGKTEICFAMISDTQRNYDETAEVVDIINSRDDIDFVVHGGDLTEYGAVREFEWQRDILSRLRVPWVCVIGNHDCLATGTDTYSVMFGPVNFSFLAGNVRFLCLNTNSLEFEANVPVPDFGFIREIAASVDDRTRKSVVLMHAGPFSDQFNNNVAPEFHALVKSLPGMQFCIYGHGHHNSVDDFFDDGLLYYECASIGKRSYLVFTISDEGYECHTVNF